MNTTPLETIKTIATPAKLTVSPVSDAGEPVSQTTPKVRRFIRRRIALFWLLGAIYGMVWISARGQALPKPGSVDLSFRCVIEDTNQVVSISKVATYPGYKILALGSFSIVEGEYRFGLVRLNADGSLDLSFDPGRGANGPISDFLIQPDGKVIVTGWFDAIRDAPRINMARLNPDGTLDQQFDASAYFTEPYLQDVSAMAVQGDGQILAAIYDPLEGGREIIRFTANGMVDNTFNAKVDGDFNRQRVDAIKIQANGQILIWGNFDRVNGQLQRNLARLFSDGQLDSSILDTGGADDHGYNRVMEVQPDGKIVVGGDFAFTIRKAVFYPDFGWVSITVGTRTNLVRFQLNGEIDETFDPGISTDAPIESLVLQPDGTMLIAGSFTNFNGCYRPRLARVNSNGTLDQTFNPTLPFNGNIASLALLGTGQLVLGGPFASETQRGLAQVSSAGAVNAGFHPRLSWQGVVNVLTPQNDGKVLLGGQFTHVGGQLHHNLARFKIDGTVDPTLNADFDGAIDAIAIQNDGKLVIGGEFLEANDGGGAFLVRLNGDGSLDSTYFTAIGAPVRSIAVQLDGKLLIQGDFRWVFSQHRNFFARLETDGYVDEEFALSTNDFSNGSRAFALQPDGKVVVAAEHLARLLPSGSIDSSFSTNVQFWESSVNLGTTNYYRAMPASLFLEPDGKIIASGAFDELRFSQRRVAVEGLARFNPDGSLDESFLGFGPCLTVEANGKLWVSFFQRDYDPVHDRFPVSFGALHLNSDGRLDTNAPPVETDDWINAMAREPDGSLLLAGKFLMINQELFTGVGRIAGEPVPPRISLQKGADGVCQLTWSSGPLAPDEIQASDDLVRWTTLLTLPSAGAPPVVVDQAAGEHRQRFYRAMVHPR